MDNNHPPPNQGLIGNPPRLILLPSVAAIVSDVPICETILQAVSAAGAHLPPNKFSMILPLLWDPVDGPFNNRFLQWAPSRASRNIKDRVMVIMDWYSQWENDTTPYPSAVQSLAKRLYDEHQDAQEEVAEEKH